MPCEDCQELYREMRRLRVIVEQNFLAMLKRLDYQDRNMVFMMELLSEGSNWESTPPYYNEDTGHFSSGMNETYYTAKGPSVRKKPRSLWTNARAACNSYPERQPWQSANNSSSARGLDREDMGREDVVADVDFGSGNRGANEPATSDARVIQNEQSAVLDCMAMESTPSMARGTYNEDGTLEGHLPNDLRRIANFVQDHEYGATAEMPLRSDGDGTVGQECRMETETNEGALGNTDNGSTSGTACVTVRSAIRMEDLDRDAGAASFSGAATATGDGGGAVDAATGKQATRVPDQSTAMGQEPDKSLNEDIERTILLFPGRLVTTNVVTRKYARFRSRVSQVKAAMARMNQARPDGPGFVGKLKRVRNIEVFYKAPVDKCDKSYLTRLKISPIDYQTSYSTELKEAPCYGLPPDWAAYYEKLMNAAPSMGVD